MQTSCRPDHQHLRRAASLSLLIGFMVPHGAWGDVGAAERTYSIRTGESSVTYHLVHKLHRVSGVSKKVEGKARILPNGQAQIMIRVPAESFDSGNSNRDAHAKETIEASRYPNVELKAACADMSPPTSLPATVTKTCKGQIDFHGVQKTLDVAVRVDYQSADRIHVVSDLTLSLEAFKIERPSLMFVKVDDALKIDADIVLGR